MDKLELDARVVRLERSVGFLKAVSVLFVLGFAAHFLVFARSTRSGGPGLHFPHPTAVATPVPPAPPMLAMPDAFPTEDLAMGSMALLHHNLATIHDLRNRGIISEAQHDAKKGMLLTEELTPGDLRSDLEMVQNLWNTQAISDAERDTLRERLLGIEE